jgi:23S rRNA (cytosine1962-C5)-methyltransferase
VGSLPDAVAIVEDGIDYRVDVVHGQKTGFYLDQRDNRHIVRRHAQGRRVLNAFCYTGGFSLAAVAGDATSVVSIDSSGDALAMARENLARNPSLDAARAQWVEADVFAELRRMRDAGTTFDMIILDPPKFAPTAAHAERAARAYKDINLLALKLLTAGGLLATFSCSGGISAELFQKIVAGAALDANADAQVIAHLTAGADHPVALNFPEGDYLKGLLIRKA